MTQERRSTALLSDKKKMDTPTLQLLYSAMIVVVCLTSGLTASDQVFTSTPPSVRPLVTDLLRLRCSLKDSASTVVVGKRDVSSNTETSDVITDTAYAEDTHKADLSYVISDTDPSDVSVVHSIMITKSGNDVASVAVKLAAQVFDNSSGVVAEGQVQGRGDEKGYLEVSWRYPGPGVAGQYQCVIAGVNDHGHIQTFTQTLDVAEAEVSRNDVVSYIHKLQLTNDLQSQTIARMNATINADIASIKATLAEHSTKLSTHVMFTAVRTSSVTVNSGSVVVFDHLRSSVGGGYDASTGVFTCPIAGLYTFEVHIFGQADKFARVCLHHNNNCMTLAFAEDSLDLQSSSNSLNILLKQGDTVQVVSERQTSYVYSETDGFSSFSGILIALV